MNDLIKKVFKVKKMLFICMGFLLLSGSVLAQQQTVTGRVVDVNNESLPGVSIIIRGTQQGTVTDINGYYSLSVQPSSVLIYSYIGYTSIEETVNGRATINITMSEDVSALDEVVVIGYGTARKRDLTGSVSSVNANDVPMTSVASIAHSLQGKAAGMIVTQNSAQPGGGLDIMIRGQSSINASNQPLYIVDGFPILQLDQAAASIGDSRTAVGTQGPLNFLNPADIATIDVLKDASATAIYGSRAANGVVLITTKRGVQGKPEVTFNATYGVQEYLDKFDTFVDLGEWMTEINTAGYESWLGSRGVYPYGGDPWGRDTELNPLTTIEQAHAATKGTVDQWELEFDANGSAIRGTQSFSDAQIAANRGVKGTDWVGLMTQTGIVQNYNVGIRGGTPITRYMISGSYFDHEGIVKNSRLTRYTGKVNLDQDLGDKIKGQLTILGSRTNNDNISHGDNQYENSGLIRSAIEFNPQVPIQDADGKFPVNPIVGNRPNPASLLYVTDNNITDRVLANASITYEPIDGLFLKYSTGMDLSYSTRGNYFPTQTLWGNQLQGDARIWNRKNSHTSNEFTANYNFDLNTVHRFSLLGGYIYEQTNSNSSNLQNDHFVTDGFLWNSMGSGAGVKGVGSGASENMRASFLGRLNYTLLDRYLFTATVRRDGSSTFARNEKWGTFPSVAVGWNMAEESFMDFSDNYLNMVKWRFSWGQTGNDDIGGRHNATYSTTQGWTQPYKGSYTAVIPGRVENPNLKWETTTEFNIGLDLDLNIWNGITASLEYYNKTISDLLQTRRTAAYQYLNSVWANVGSTQSSGVEVTVNFRNINRRDFTWNTDFTFTKFEDRWKERDSQWTPNIYEKANDVLRPIYSQHALGILQKGDDIPLHHLTPQYGGTGTSTLRPGGLIIADLNGPMLDADGNPMVDENGKVILTGKPDGIIDDADRVFIGSRDPGFIIGLGNRFTYKSFDFNLYMYGMFDRIMEDPNFMMWGRSPGNMVSQQVNQLRSVKERWMDEAIFPDRKESTTHPRSGTADWFYDDAWFIRAQNITLGYTLPKTSVLSNYLESLRVHFDVNNAFVITPYRGNDPETDRFSGAYPNARTFTFGIDLKF